MSIKTLWLDENHTTILQVFNRTWTDEEFEKQYHQVETLVDSVDYAVSLIVDLHNLDMEDASHHIPEHEKFAKKLHTVVVVNEDNIFLKALLPFVNRITPPTKKSPIVIVNGIDEAYEVLNLHPHSAA